MHQYCLIRKAECAVDCARHARAREIAESSAEHVAPPGESCLRDNESEQLKCELWSRPCKEPVKHSVRIRVESGDLARVIDPSDLRHFDSVVKRLGRVVQKRVLSGSQVVQESMLASSGIAIIAHRYPLVVDAKNLREDERC